MARYYFDVINGDILNRDLFGVDLADDERPGMKPSPSCMRCLGTSYRKATATSSWHKPGMKMV